MRRFRHLTSIVIGVLVIVAALSPSGAAADDLPRTFAGCLLGGGDIGRVDGEITCRLIRAYDFRVYGSGTTECGEPIEFEIWGQTREGVVTYAFEPGRMVALPEDGLEDMTLPDEPIPCLND